MALSRLQRIRINVVGILRDFLEQHVPKEEQKKGWEFRPSDIDPPFFIWWHSARDMHRSECEDCKTLPNHRGCPMDEAFQATCPGPITGTSKELHQYLLRHYWHIDLISGICTLSPSAFPRKAPGLEVV